MPRVGRWRNRPLHPREDPKNVLFQRFSILWTPDSGSQLLGNDDAQVFEWREDAMELLESFVRATVAKRVYEELRV